MRGELYCGWRPRLATIYKALHSQYFTPSH
jgi:hypothetical protein